MRLIHLRNARGLKKCLSTCFIPARSRFGLTLDVWLGSDRARKWLSHPVSSVVANLRGMNFAGLPSRRQFLKSTLATTLVMPDALRVLAAEPRNGIPYR